MAVRASSSQAALIANCRDGNRPKPVSLPLRMRSSTRAWPRWRTSRYWMEPPPDRGVGGEDLVAQAVDGVEQVQLRAGVRAFPAHDQPRAGREARPGPPAATRWVISTTSAPSRRSAVGVERGIQAGGARVIASRTGSVTGTPTEKNVCTPSVAQAADVGQERLACSRRCRCGSGRRCRSGARRGSGRGPVEHRDVVGGGVRPGPSRAQDPGQGLAGVVAGTQKIGW